MARTGQAITHDALDALPSGRNVNYIREILVCTEILAPRNEYLERIEPWLERHLVDHPAEHSHLVRSYAVWCLLHRARRSNRKLAVSGAQRIRNRVRVALEFLAWIDDRGRTLTTIDQGDVDAWLANGNWRHREIRGFLHWTCQRRITDGMSAPANYPGQPSIFIDEADQLDQLHRCLNDDSIDTDLRAGGALILLYAITTTRVLALRRNQLTIKDADTYLTMGEHELVLPPKLAELLIAMPRSTRRSSLPEQSAPDSLPFPGRTPNRPVDAGGFGKRLKNNGFTIRGGRNTALIGLAAELPAAELPAAVLADLLAIDAGTATRRSKYAKRDWNDYLAERHGHARPSVSGDGTGTASCSSLRID
ncbi:MAG: hypothetical protein ACSLE6_13640 [Mycobacterium sp.]